MMNFKRTGEVAIATVVSLCATWMLVGCEKEKSPVTTSNPSTLASEVQQLEQASFQQEQDARKVENNGIVPFWNQLNRARTEAKLRQLAALPLEKITLGTRETQKSLDLGILHSSYKSGTTTMGAPEWKNWLGNLESKGFEMVHSDWHQESFTRDTEGVAHSEIRFKILATQKSQSARWQVSGKLSVVWDESSSPFRPRTIKLLSAQVVHRKGKPAFVKKIHIEGGRTGKQGQTRLDMGSVCVADLNGDQLPEILLGNANQILWNQGGFKFKPSPLVPQNGRIFPSVVACVADFTGDTIPDWLCETKTGAMALYRGKPQGGFEPNPSRIDLGKHPLKIPTCITAGDIDNDGDLDLFVGQWRPLYEKAPDKYWDANDGFGNSLFINDGLGNFREATVQCGLGEKRFRRTYSASLLDIDDDSDLDLLVVSDFYGTDIYLNQGNGTFKDATNEMVDKPHSFGMSHTVGDYNSDGKLDLFVMGMGSTTARRLEKMKANPAEHATANKMRMTMGYGNRMYLRQGNTYSAPQFMDQVARTGWSWGSSTFDFDNDGDQDIYIANGHISGKSTRDYCTNFWCRDIYLLKNRPSAMVNDYLQTIPQMNEQSWDGYQVNPLLTNQSGNGFYDLGFVLDVGFNFDARRVVTADLDLDGRVDLLVTKIEGTSGFFDDGQGNKSAPALYVMRNEIEHDPPRHWIGVTLPTRPGFHPMGAKIQVVTNNSTQSGMILSGDSFSCQHPAAKHFGLGTNSSVKELHIIWPNGKRSLIKNPTIDTYHKIEPPAS